MSKNIKVACDVGGTFTDLVYYKVKEKVKEMGEIHTAKVHSTPPNFGEGVMNSLSKEQIKGLEIETFSHGTTAVINALSERKGVKTGLITTKGFRDILEIARGDRPDFFNLKYKKPTPFVPRHLRKEITERIDYKGNVLSSLKLDELPDIMRSFREEGVEAIAICLLHSYAYPQHEKELINVIKKQWPDFYTIASHSVTREWREYERTNTAVLSSYVQPIVDNYITRLEDALIEEKFSGSIYIMKSNGGVDTIKAAKSSPITMIESGPASGMLGAAKLGELINEPNIIGLDIGGTTAKCSLIENNQLPVTTKYMIERSDVSSGYPIMTPVVDIVEIGNGGGSIAWLDDHNKLHVGPQSAGAIPGPVAYGKGGNKPTTTDANIMLKRINPDYFFGGDIIVDMEKVEKAMKNLATPLGLTNQEIAKGIIRIANNNMVNALKLVSINRGYDPRDFAMVAFGGGGALHGAFLAKELNIPRVIIPANAAVFSAWGMLMSDLRRDFIITDPLYLNKISIPKINQRMAEMENDATSDFRSDGFSSDQIRLERMADMRYEGQEHTIRVPLPDNINISQLSEIEERFHKNYEKKYTYCLDKPIQLVSYHLIAFAQSGQPKLPKIQKKKENEKINIKEYRDVDFGEIGVHNASIYDRKALKANTKFSGPAIIEESSTTTVILPGQSAEIDKYGNIHIHVNP
ncbi:MAG TPA: hydantoinase/oxoprolinase family protein [Bacteroidales bacterium]|nr:hydantoinase/oxoprolinase family protein [Bacteroidales bacterium]